MKRVTFLAAAIAVLGLTSVDASAQSTTQQVPAQAEQKAQEGKKELVTQDQLPPAVQAALKSDTYKDWTVGEIYKIVPAEGEKAVFEVAMTNAQGQTGVVRMDEQGGDASAATKE